MTGVQTCALPIYHYPIAARNGFFWWEYDVTYYFLRFMQFLGIIRDLHALPPEKREYGRLNRSRDLQQTDRIEARSS